MWVKNKIATIILLKKSFIVFGSEFVEFFKLQTASIHPDPVRKYAWGVVNYFINLENCFPFLPSIDSNHRTQIR